jgi:hypothetical protein
MILTTHILSGAALGANIQNPWLVAGLSTILHFILDLFPHGDYLNQKSTWRDFWKVIIDLAFGLGIVFIIILFRDPAPQTILNIAIGIFFSLLPDGTTFLYLFMKMKFIKPLKTFHENLHYYKNGAPEREFRLKNNLGDIFISLVSLIILIFSR